MLWTIFLILIVTWMLGMVSAYTMGGFIHISLVIGGRSRGDTADQWTSSPLQIEGCWDFPGALQVI
jgi:hypothetical protein